MSLQRGSRIRLLLATVVVIALVTAIGAIALPFAISTDLVRDRLERDISQWTGHEVELLDTPEIAYWPVPQVSLRRISISSRSFPEAEPIVYADEMRADISLLSALIGNPRFSNYVLVRPVFWVEQFHEGNSSWNSRSGRISEGVSTAIRRAESSESNRDSIGPVPDYPLGNITIQDGSFTWLDHRNGNSEKLTAINGTISWPRLGQNLAVNIGGIYRGEAFTLSLVSAQPLLLLAQKTSRIDLQFASTPLTMRFGGTVTVGEALFANGTLSMRSPSMRQTLAWTGAEIKPGEAIGAMSLDAEVQLQNQRAMLDKVILELEGNRGIGILDIRNNNGKPGISGTLAFNSLDLTSFLQAFTPLPSTGEEIAETIDTSFLNQLAMDMRLSAQSATLGKLSMTNVAAAVRIDAGRATFDIGDADAYGGSVLGRIVLAESGIEGGGEIRVSATDVNLQEALAALQINGPFPQGTARLNIALSTPFPTWATGLKDIAGNFELSIVNGFVPSFDPVQFRALAATERFFGLGGIASGSFPFTSAEFKATFADGIAEVSRGEIVGQNAVLSLSGIIPYQRGGLALIGLLEETATVATTSDLRQPDNRIQFFVGGSWPAPVISPIIGN